MASSSSTSRSLVDLCSTNRDSASRASSAAPRLSSSEQVPTPSMVTASLIRGWPNLRTCSIPSASRRSAALASIRSQSGRSAAPAGPAWSQVHGPVRARIPDEASASSTASRWLTPGSSNRVVPNRIISAAACWACTYMSCSVRAAKDG